MDNLEEYIRKNREELDRYKPSLASWKKIRKTLNKRQLTIRKWLSIAAMFTVILGGLTIFIRFSELPQGRRLGSLDRDSGKLYNQLNETEIYYNNLVSTLYNEVTPMLIANPEINKEFGSDISQLDSISLEIKKDLKDNIANQEVIEALIQNYRIKIQLLQDLLAILHKNEENTVKSNNYEL